MQNRGAETCLKNQLKMRQFPVFAYPDEVRMDLRGLPGRLGIKRLRETVPVQAVRCRIDGGRDANRILVKSLSILLEDRFVKIRYPSFNWDLLGWYPPAGMPGVEPPRHWFDAHPTGGQNAEPGSDAGFLP
jgi:hypothetical protein